MAPKDQKWVLPILVVFMVLFIGLTNLQAGKAWYQGIKDYQISTIKPSELGSWIVQGFNDFYPVSLSETGETEITNIPALVSLKTGSDLPKAVKKMAPYKKYVIITPDGTIDDASAAVLTENWQRRVILLEGGEVAWNEQVTAKDIDELELSREDMIAVQNIRPFFQGTAMEGGVEFKAKAVTPPPMLEEEEEEEVIEGC